MPKATANVVSASPYHNHSAGDLADELGRLAVEFAELEGRRKAFREEMIRRGVAEAGRGDVPRHRERRGALDPRCQSRPRRNGRCVVECARPAIAGDERRSIVIRRRALAL
jgi:hypothetical protein